MKDTVLLLIANTPAILCIGGAILMAINGVGGWGWVLFVGLCITVTAVRSSDDYSDD